MWSTPESCTVPNGQTSANMGRSILHFNMKKLHQTLIRLSKAFKYDPSIHLPIHFVKMRATISLCFLTFISLSGYTQNPGNDKSWILDNSVSDDFSGITIDQAKWDYHPPWSTCHGESCLTTDSSNRKVENGVLKLIVRKQTCTCIDWDGTTHNKNYTSGAIFSKSTFKYGYFEIRCRIPELKNSYFTGKGFGPNFWMWPSLDWKSTYPSVEWSEIDIYEFDAETNLHTCNVHYKDTSMLYKWELRSYPDPYDFTVDFSSYHTFGCEWTPSYINFYIDDKLIRSTNTPYAENLIPMNIWVDINVPATNFNKNFVPNSLFPYTYEIDYVRIYNLQMDCNTVVNQSNINFSTFNYAVKKSITISNSTIPFYNKVTLRATDFVQINGEFTVPLGSEFAIVPTPCF